MCQVLACTRDWKITILMAVVMPIAGLCMALSVEVVRNFAMVVEACYAKAGEIAAPWRWALRKAHPFFPNKGRLVDNEINTGASKPRCSIQAHQHPKFS